jgi:hypothetical protein
MIQRRGFLAGIGAFLAAPAIIRTPGLLMPVKPPVVIASSLTMTEIVEITMRNRLEQLAYNVTLDNALLARLNKRPATLGPVFVQLPTYYTVQA